MYMLAEVLVFQYVVASSLQYVYASKGIGVTLCSRMHPTAIHNGRGREYAVLVASVLL
jgi:hypothetical protein